MARMARVVVPGIPHHITQRGNRRQETFFCDEDYHEHLALMATSERTGRPLGNEIFMERLENMVGRVLRRQKPGLKKKRSDKWGYCPWNTPEY